VTAFQYLKQRWNEPGGYRQVLAVSVPLILSMGAWTLQHFVDRVFLSWYSTDALAAAMPASIVNFTVSCLFTGTAGYVNTFVAQYYGAKRFDRIGPAVWQGIYFSLVGGLFMAGMVPVAGPIFRSIGHPLAVQALEITYFQTICFAGFPVIACTVLSCFYTGRGKTWIVMKLSCVYTGVNIVLDYVLIFGHFGFPEMGIFGAGLATVTAETVGVILFLGLMLRRRHDMYYGTRSGWRFDPELFKRLMRYGFPNGVQFFVDVAGFMGFTLLIGRLGTVELAASNIAFNINTIAFLPMIGFGIGTSVLVGQYLGENRIRLSEHATYSCFHLTMVYMTAMAVLYVAVPQVFLWPYSFKADPATFQTVREVSIVLLRFVALYSLFDAMNIIFAGALKGAGDTRFIMKMLVILSLSLLVIPSYFVIVVFRQDLYAAWAVLAAYIIVLAFAFYFRFRTGVWKSMRVIEEAPGPLPAQVSEYPAGEYSSEPVIG